MPKPDIEELLPSEDALRKSIGHALREAMRVHNLKFKDVVERSGLAPQTLRGILREYGRPTFSNIAAAFHGCGIHVSAISFTPARYNTSSTIHDTTHDKIPRT